MSREELDRIWGFIKDEAKSLADCEPLLASFFNATLLKHDNLGSALSYMLANKLSSPIMPAMEVREIVEQAYRNDEQMIFLLRWIYPPCVCVTRRLINILLLCYT